MGGSRLAVERSSGNNLTNTLLYDGAPISIVEGEAPFSGAFRPEGALADLNGVAMDGTWTLYVLDDAGSDTGTLDSWTLRIAY